MSSQHHQEQVIMNPFKINKPQFHYSSIYHNNTTYLHIWILAYEFIVDND